MNMLWIYTIIGLLGYFSETNGLPCTNSQITKCDIPTTDLRKELGISDELDHFPVYMLNDTYLDKYCKAATSSAGCLHSMERCPDEVKLITGGLIEATAYLCEDTLTEYKSYQECYRHVDVQLKMESCDKKYERRFKRITEKDEFCQTIDEWYNCFRGAAKPECSDAAAEWQVNYLKKVLGPSLGKLNCGFSKFYLAIIVIVCLVFLVIVGIVIYRNRSRCKRNSSKGNPSPVLTFSTDANA